MVSDFVAIENNCITILWKPVQKRHIQKFTQHHVEFVKYLQNTTGLNIFLHLYMKNENIIPMA